MDEPVSAPGHPRRDPLERSAFSGRGPWPQTGYNGRNHSGMVSMKIAIAQEGSAVSAHFGHCEGYAVYSIENGTAVREADLANPGHQPGFLPVYLGEHGIGAVIAGGMGPRAVDLFCQNGIEVVLGVAGPLDEVARSYAAGTLEGGVGVCNHDHCSGDCGSH